MRTLVVNPGSSSLKLSIVDSGVALAVQVVDDWDGTPDPTLVDRLSAEHGRFDAVGLRVVHGGDRTGPTVLDGHELERLRQLVPLAPLHQPRSLLLARALRSWLPDVPVVGCFDTAFHSTLPDSAATYPIPMEWTHKFGIRRFGFHGLSCAYALRYTAEFLGREPSSLSLICCHIGAGVSVTAIEAGRSVDTSMGYTPLDGVAMATRSGALDPGLLVHLLREMSLSELDSALNQHSGLAGMSGTSGDIREVLAARVAGCPDAALAVRVYLHRLRREIAAARTSLSRLDALVLTGGVAEHQPELCAELVLGLDFLGVRPELMIVQAREDLEMAREVESVLRGGTRVHS